MTILHNPNYYADYEDHKIPKHHHGQPKAWSLLESITNIVVGVVLAFSSQIAIFSWYGIPISWHLNLEMTGWFTIVSLLRSFLLRRLFNRISPFKK